MGNIQQFQNKRHELPSGGTTGQVLKKNTGTDYDVAWTTLSTPMTYTAGTGIDISNTGVISVEENYTAVPVATASTLGVVKVGSGLSVNSSGTLSTPIASTSTLGGVIVGDNLSISENGVLSAGGASYVTVSTASIVQALQNNTVYNFTNNNISNITLTATAGCKHCVFRFINKQNTTINYDSSWKWYGDNCYNSEPHLVTNGDYECTLDLRYNNDYAINVKKVSQPGQALSNYAVSDDTFITANSDSISDLTLVIGNTTTVSISTNTLII